MHCKSCVEMNAGLIKYSKITTINNGQLSTPQYYGLNIRFGNIIKTL